MKRRSYQKGSVVAVKKNGKIAAWDFRWREDGRNKSERLGSIEKFPLKAKAEKAAEPLRLRINDDREVVRFHQLAARFEAEELPERMSTRSGYRSNLRRLRTSWDDVRLTEMANDPMRIEIWLKDLRTLPERGPVRPMRKKSKQNVRNLLHLLFDRAMAWKYLSLQRNPIELVRLKEPAGIKSKPRDRDLVSPADFSAMLMDKETPQNVRVMIAVAMCTGIRVSEILGLRWECINFENGFISIEVSAVGKHQDVPKTESSEEVVPMHEALGKILMDWRRKLPSVNGWVFGNPVTGRPYWRDSMQNYLVKLGDKLRIENLGWHSFRHTYRRMLDDLDTPLEVQRHLMRHSSTAMTEKYGRKKGAKLHLTRPANEQLVKSLLIPEEFPMRQAETCTNRSGFYGVYPQGEKYAAKMSLMGKKLYLGLFDRPEDAARRYDQEARRRKGITASLNFPEESVAKWHMESRISLQNAVPFDEPPAQ
jgi:integrase